MSLLLGVTLFNLETMSIKITDLPKVEPQDGDSLLGVVDGKASLVPISNFLKKDEKADSASSLMDKNGNVILPEEILKNTDTATDSKKLGGIGAEQYATKRDVEVATGKAVNYTWACPIAWFSITKMPDLLSPDNGSIFAPCDGRELAKKDYPELAELLTDADGKSIFRDANGLSPTNQDNFFLPNLCGRVIAGVNKGMFTTPTDDVVGLDENGNIILVQAGISSIIGLQGGSVSSKLLSQTQLPKHSHNISSDSNFPYILANSIREADNFDIDRAGNDKGSAYRVTEQNGTDFVTRTGNTGEPKESVTGFSIIPPYTTFCYIMRLKP